MPPPNRSSTSDVRDTPAPAGAGSRPIALLIGCAAALVVAIVISTAMMIVNLRERALHNSERELKNVALMLGSQVDRIFDTAERLQTSLIERFDARGAMTVEDFERALSGFDVHLMLRDKIVGQPHLGTFTMVNAAGKVFNFSRFWPIPEISVADRDFFTALRDNPELTTFIGKPVSNRATGTWVIHIARKVTGPRNEFLGLLTAVVELDALEKFFSTIALGPESSVFLVHRDGELLARHPHAAAYIGRKVVDPSVLHPVFETGTASGRRNGVDDLDRLMAAQSVGRYPMVVGATTSVAAVLSGWRRESLFLGGAGGLAGLLIAAFAYVIVRKLLHSDRQVQRTLAQQKLQLDAALDHMLQGLCMFDAAGRLVIHNRRYVEMYGLSTERIKPGCSLLEVLRARKAAGTFSGDPEQYAAELSQDIALGKTTTYAVETEDGRHFHVINQPTRTGGWVSTHEDVTDWRRTERERERDRKLLDLVVENVPTAIFLRDATEKRYVLVNRAAEEIWEVSRENLIGKTAREVFPEQFEATIGARDDQLLEFQSALFFGEHELRTYAGNTRIVTSRLHLVQGEDEDRKYVLGVVEDVTEKKRADERIAHMARHNALTDLPNRILFRERLEQILKWRRKDERVAVLTLGLDHFRNVNDTLGHPVGDKLLKAVAGRLRNCVTEVDAVAHMGGDEFAIIQTGIDQPDEVTQFVKRIGEWLRAPYDLDGHHVALTSSIGIAIAPDDGSEPDQLIKDAGMALHRAKADGRDGYRFFEAEMDARMKARRALELDIRKAIANNELELHYQPLVDTRHNTITGCEALLRWRHPQRGMISPAEFVPIAEETGLIESLGEWALRTACRDAATWPNEISVAVNLSPVQFRRSTLALTVTNALVAAGLAPERLELEITESVLMQNNEATLATLHQLRDLGVRIAMDDFGTGYSSLSYLRSFPFNKIKIDRSFIADLSERAEATVIVQAISDLARNLNMTTTAEGVENEAQREIVRAAGCTEMQGYLFSAPRPLADLWPLLKPAARKAG